MSMSSVAEALRIAPFTSYVLLITVNVSESLAIRTTGIVNTTVGMYVRWTKTTLWLYYHILVPSPPSIEGGRGTRKSPPGFEIITGSHVYMCMRLYSALSTCIRLRFSGSSLNFLLQPDKKCLWDGSNTISSLWLYVCWNLVLAFMQWDDSTLQVSPPLPRTSHMSLITELPMTHMWWWTWCGKLPLKWIEMEWVWSTPSS